MDRIFRMLDAAKAIIALIVASISINAHSAINIVAAENIYGEVAQEIGGPYVNVLSILNNPSEDPHLFTTTPSTARAVSDADIIIYNGADYDPWMSSLLKIDNGKKRAVINVATLINAQAGDNPHIWYKPETMPLFAKALAAQLIGMDPQHKQYYEHNLRQFTQDYGAIYKKIQEIKQRYQNTPVIATEPVFGYMAASLGLKMHDEGFQISMMNDVPPTVTQTRSFEDDLTRHVVHVLIYNNQVINPLAEHMRSIAVNEKIPVVGVSELIPPGMTYIQWIRRELDDLQHALESSAGEK